MVLHVKAELVSEVDSSSEENFKKVKERKGNKRRQLDLFTTLG